ncbi:titin, partial [Astyanax mexicanus]
FFPFSFLVPAKIYLPLHLQGMGAVHAVRGEVVTIKIPISGKPDPAITWQKGQEILNNTVRHQVIVTRSFTSLVFQKGVERKDSGYYVICECDDGLYRCKVVTEEREDNAYAELFVETVRPPEFTLPLYNRTAYIGEDVRFGVTITVHPEPQVTWLKAGHRIKPDPAKYTFTSDKGLYQLMIHNVELVDDGEYTVVANNKFGEDSCKARLTVTPHPVVEDTMRPMFKRLLANIECVEGQSVQFDLRVSGTPPPTLKWEKDGKPLECRPQVEVVQQAVDHHILYIRETLIEDSGTYRVTATNSAGSASCQATLKVERITYTRREFKTLPEDISIETGKVLTVACAFSGEPSPHIEWSRGGKTLPTAEEIGRFHVETTEDLTTLIITGVKESDAGVYTLKLSNEHGSDTATVIISIRSL